MKKEIKSEEDAKKLLKVKNFNKMSKEKVVELITILPKVSGDVAYSIINRVPDYTSMILAIIDKLIDVCNTVINNEDKSHTAAMEGYKEVLESLKEQLKDENLTFEQKMEINEKMLEVANHISEKDSEKKGTITSLFETGGKITSSAIAVAGYFTKMK